MANEYLQRTPTSTGNRKVWTWSGWVKKQGEGVLFYNAQDSTPYLAVGRFVSDGLQAVRNESASVTDISSDAKLRDFSSWKHVCIAWDTTASTESDRTKLYINGVLQSVSGTYATKNYEGGINRTNAHTIGGVLVSGSIADVFEGELTDIYFVDGQALTPDVFGFYKEGKGYISAGSTQATDFRPGQWVPKAPRVIKTEINRKGGFGVNGFYLPMNDSSNFGADFHTTPNSIITLKGEDLPQPQNGAPTTTDSYVSQLRSDPYAANLVLAVPGITGAPGVAYTDFSANIKGSGTNKVLTAVGNAGVSVTASYYGSAMSFDGTGDYFTIPANTSDLLMGSDDFTIEAWVNKNDTGNGGIFGLYDNGNDRRSYLLYSDGSGDLTGIVSTDGTSSTNTLLGGSAATNLGTNQWHHCVLEREGSYLRLYLNGVVAGISTDLSGSLYENTTDTPAIGTWFNSGVVTGDIDGYIQDVRVYKGVAKYKGGFDVPKPYTPVGIGTWRAVPDCTANNFATLNTLHGSTSGTYANGNLTIGNPGTANIMEYHPTIGMTQGKWYCEARVDVYDDSNRWHFGVSSRNLLRDASNQNGSNPGDATVVSHNTAQYRVVNRDHNGDAYYPGSPADQLVNGDIVGVAVSITTPVASAGAATTNFGTIQFYRNGSTYGDELNLYRHQLPLTGVGGTTPYTGEWFFAAHSRYTSQTSVNFGQNPTFSGNTTAGTFTDGNGKGLFKYQPPTGFLALCEDNLPTPAIADPGEHFKCVLYTGTGNANNITSVGFKPDFIWIKERTSTSSNQLMDSVRGLDYVLYSNATNEEFSRITQAGSTFSSTDTGFSIGTNDTGINESGQTYVAWCWKAGAGTTSTNTDGSIDSVVSVNQDAGFSIVSYTGNGTNATVGHGLNKTPKFIITKNRDASVNWIIYHSSVGATQYLRFTTNAATTQSSIFNDTEPTSSVFSLGSSTTPNGNGQKQIAYCWAEIEGFSKFGSYIGNGDADGPFVYCGFKPALVIARRSDDTASWVMMDSSRTPNNPVNVWLNPDQNVVDQSTSEFIDFTSNGFKWRYAGANNSNGGTHIFAAFAESPFQTANAK